MRRNNRAEKRISVNSELLVLTAALGVGYAVGLRINDLEKAYEIALEIKQGINNVDTEKMSDDFLKELSSLKDRVNDLISSHKKRSISNTLKFWKTDHKFEIGEALRLKRDYINFISRIEKKEL